MVEAVIRLFRPLAVALGTGALAGLVIGGACSRIAMRLIALADDRQDFGRVTSAQAVVGDVTAGGTLAVFGAGFSLAVLGAVLYVALRRWLPASPLLRTLAFAWTLMGLGLLLTVEGNKEDFTFLHLGLSLGLFGATLLLFGLVVPPLATSVPLSEQAVFVGVQGGRLNYTQLGQSFRRYVEASGVGERKHVTPRTLRHVFASELLRAGANLRQVQELLGHKHLDSTKRYTRVNAHELRGAVKRLRWVG